MIQQHADLVTTLVVVAVLLGAPGCGLPGEITTPETRENGAASAAAEPACPPPVLTVWPADEALAALAAAAAERILAASGLTVVVGPDVSGAVPLLWTTRLEASGWNGHWSVTGRSEWLAVDEAAPPELFEQIVLHEMLHALGAAHIEELGGGVMSKDSWVREEGWPLTAADLESLCIDARDDCTHFAPE